MKTMMAKYAGKCAACGEPIKRGEQICFFGRGRAEHKTCTEGADDDEQEFGEDEQAGLEPGTLASDRRLAKRGLSVIRFSSGAVMTQNAKGRCEDAPCCGCCT
jgi:hypothetical protein